MNIISDFPVSLTYMQWQILFSVAGGVLILLIVLWIWWRSHKKSREREQYFSTIFGGDPSVRSNGIHTEDILIESVGDIFDDVLSSPRATQIKVKENVDESNLEPNLAVLYVLTPNKTSFDVKDLLESLHAENLMYGDMNIFHRYHAEKENASIFSVASATEPGYFDLKQMHLTPCKGLCFFADLSTLNDPKAGLTLMIETAKKIAASLEATLHDYARAPWESSTTDRYYNLLKN